jgi:hypothetical protein
MLRRNITPGCKLRAATLAIAAMLSSLIAPFCATLCNARHHCSPQDTPARAGAQDCHHFAISNDSEAPPPVVVTERNCARVEVLAVIAATIPLRSDRFFAVPSLLVQTHISSFLNQTPVPEAGGGSPPATIFLRSVVLQI